jgi:hypothetical protein
LIVTAALKLRQEQFVIDGEIVVLNRNGVPDFEAPHSWKHNARAQLYAFDLLAADGGDHRAQALLMRKANLVRLVSRRVRASSSVASEPHHAVRLVGERRRAGDYFSFRPRLEASFASRRWDLDICEIEPVALHGRQSLLLKILIFYPNPQHELASDYQDFPEVRPWPFVGREIVPGSFKGEAV